MLIDISVEQRAKTKLWEKVVNKINLHLHSSLDIVILIRSENHKFLVEDFCILDMLKMFWRYQQSINNVLYILTVHRCK